MRAAALRKPADGWDIPTVEDDAETQVYFHPEPELLPPIDAMPPVRLSLPIDVAPVAPVVRFAPPPPPPRPQPIPTIYARPRPAPPIEVQHTARVRRQSVDARRTVVITLSGACAVAAMMIVTAVLLRGSHASHAGASVVMAPPPAPVSTVIATPIEPAPAADHRNVVIVSEAPAFVAPPQPVQAVAPAPRAHRSHHGAAAPVAVAAAPTGTLELSSKPPCEIVIDGNATGLTTPRKGIAVAAGRHQVTLRNAEAGIRFTAPLTVTAGHATRMIRDFTK